MKLKALVVITLVVFSCSVMFAAGHSKALSQGQGRAFGSGEMKHIPHANGAQYTYWYYTGSFDAAALNGLANGLFNATTNFGVDGIVDTAMENPGVANTIVDIAIFELATGVSDNDGGYWEVRDGNVSAGNGGTLLKSGQCKSVSTINTGATGFGLPLFQMDCQLKKPVKLKAGVSYWVAYRPDFNNGNFGYLANVEDVPAFGQFGGSDEYYGSFFSSTYFGENFEPTGTASGSLSPYGDEFSIALAH